MLEVKEKTVLSSSTFSLKNKLIRLLWAVVYALFFKFSPIPLRRYRLFILNLFGAKVSYSANVYPSANIWLPSNLILAANSTLGPNVNVYNQGEITIGENVIISQGSHLCASTHDYNDPLHPLILAPIHIKNEVWVCAEVFIGPNVQIEQGCVIGARAVLTKNTESWGVYAGNPCRRVNERRIFS